jgi:NADH:ubiquinone oxidoreductase subunit 5 (subunit L)/multisubunit Na+/H+ antiporter MnhA subunit
LLDSIHASPALLLDFTHTNTYRLKAACTAMTMTRLGSLEYIIGLLFLLLVTLLSMIRPFFPYFCNSNITCTLLDSINANPALLLDFTHTDTYRFKATCTAMAMTGLGTLEYIVGILLVRLVVATLLSRIHRGRL